MLDVKFFNKQKLIVLKKYKDHIFIDAKDVKGTPFKGYSTKGSKWVTMKVKKEFRNNAPEEGYSYKQAKEGNMFKRQDSKYASKTSPVLTGDLMRDLALSKVTNTGFFIGWNVWGAKVISLNKQKRKITTKDKPLPDSVVRFMDKKLEKNIYKKHIKPNCKTTKHKIGK